MLALALLSVLSAAEPQKPTIAVLYFDNRTSKPDFDLLRKGVADMMVTDLVAWDGVRVVDRMRLEEVLTELKLQHTKAFDQATASKLGKLLAADYLLAGSLNSSGGKLVVDAQLRKVGNNQVVTSARVMGNPDDIFDLEQELVGKVTQGIDLKLKDASARKKAKVPDLDALLAYSKAIDLSDQGKVDEANAAIAALVSKAPAFLMAREKKQEILKHLQELDKLRKDLVTDSVLKAGKLADDALKDEAKFDTLTEQQQGHLLAMRMVKGRYMLRVLKQFLSKHSENSRVVLKGKEAEALNVMRGWAENQRRLGEEYDTWTAQHGTLVSGVKLPPSASGALDDATQKMLRDANLGEVNPDSEPLDTLARFVLDGYALDGEKSYTVEPALGDLDPKEHAAVFAALDAAVDKALKLHPNAGRLQQKLEGDIYRWTELKAEALVREDRDEDAIGVYQKFLDAFPTNSQATQCERHIKELLGAEHEYTHGRREEWAEGLKQCKADSINGGRTTALERKVRRMGIAGIAAQAAELEKACKPNEKTRWAFAHVYSEMALEAGRDDDCDGFRHWFQKNLEMGGSVSDMMGYQKNYVPWCELGDVERQVTSFYAKLDRDWEFELNRHLVSVLSHGDGKMLTLMGGKDGLTKDSFTLVLDRIGPNEFKCREAQWTRDDEHEKGTCQVTLTHFATEVGDHDEGTFSASFIEKDGRFTRHVELTDGHFRLRRE